MNTILGPVPLPKMAVYAFHKDSRIREACVLERDQTRENDGIREGKGREGRKAELARSLALSSLNETIVLCEDCARSSLASFSL